MIHIKRNICLVAVSCTLLAGIPLQGVAQTGRTAKVQATQSNKITVRVRYWTRRQMTR